MDRQAGFVVTSRETLFELSPDLLTTAPWEPVVDVKGDGERFLMMRRVPEVDEGAEHRFILVENFLQWLGNAEN